MNSAAIEDGTYYYLSVILIVLYILGSLRKSRAFIFILMQRLFLGLLVPICLILCYILCVISFWPLSFLSTLFGWNPSLTPQMVGQLTHDLITILLFWIHKTFYKLFAFYRRNIDHQKAELINSQKNALANSIMIKLIMEWLLYSLSMQWRRVWQGALRYFKIKRSPRRIRSAKIHMRTCSFSRSTPQYRTKPGLRRNNPAYPKMASSKLHLRRFPSQTYEYNQKT